MSVTNRKVLKLAGSTLESIKNLSDGEVIQAREILVTTDTGDIIIGLGNGGYKVIGSAGVGPSTEKETTDPVKGKLFYDTDLNNFFIGDGSQWIKISGGSGVVGAVENNFVTFGSGGEFKDSGFLANDSLVDTNVIWSSHKISSAIENAISGMSWQHPVKSIVVDLPTENISDGDRYLILSDGTDVNLRNKIVTYNDGEWVATDPIDGMAVFVEDTDKQYAYNGTDWVNLSAGLRYINGDGLNLTDNVFSVKVAENGGILVTPTGISLNLDNTTIVLNNEGKAEIGELDFGTF